jgi:hypothetical protein
MLQAGRLRNGGSTPSRRDFSLLQNVHMALPSTQPHTQCILDIKQLRHDTFMACTGATLPVFYLYFSFYCAPYSYFIHKSSVLYLTNWQHRKIKLSRRTPNFDVWHPVVLPVLTVLIHHQTELYINKQLLTLF